MHLLVFPGIGSGLYPGVQLFTNSFLPPGAFNLFSSHVPELGVGIGVEVIPGDVIGVGPEGVRVGCLGEDVGVVPKTWQRPNPSQVRPELQVTPLQQGFP